MQKETEDKFQWLADSVPVGISQMRYDGKGLKIEYANKGLYNILRCSKEDYEKKHDNYYNAVILPKDWERMEQEIRRCIREWTQLEMEYSILDINNRVGWRLMHAIPMKEENGVWFQCSISDITTLKETERKLDSLVENFPGCIIRVFYSGTQVNLEYVSEGIRKLTGYTQEEYKQYFTYSAKEMFSDNESVRGREFLDAAIVHGKGIRKEYCISDKNGDMRWIEIRSAIVSKAEDSVVVQYVLLDINEQKQAEDWAEKERARLEVVAGLSTDSVFEYDIQTDRMQYYNRKELVIDEERNLPFIEHYTERILDGSIVEKLFHKDDVKKLTELCMDLRSGKPEIYTEVRKQYEQNKYYWVAVEGKTIPDKQGKASMVIGKISNIDERIRREQELKVQTERDYLTGLYNSQTVKQKIAEKLAQGVAENAYVVVTDIDEFSNINDTMGHLFGDAILCTFADSLTEFFPEGIMGRTGGEEFLIYMERLESSEILDRVEKLNKRFERIRAGESDEIKVTASFGFARCGQGKNSLEKLEKQADTALVFLKENAKGTVMVYDDNMSSKMVQRSKKTPIKESHERVIHTEGDLLSYAYELFDTMKDLKGVIRLLSDMVTRFFHFQDIIYVRRQPNLSMKMLFHWGENNTQQFYEDRTLEYADEIDWKNLLFQDWEKDHVVLLESDFVGENVNGAKSMLSIRVDEGGQDGYIICIDRKETKSWEDELPTLHRLGEFVIRRYMQLKEKQIKEAEAEFRTKYDWVTGLSNYSNFLNFCNDYVVEHQEQKLALVYTDFTNFQFINEVHGYAEGDKVLQEYAKVLGDGSGIFHARVTADRFVSLYEFRNLEFLRKEILELGEGFCQMANMKYEHCRLGMAAGIAEVDKNLESIALNVDNANVARKSAKQDLSVEVVIYTQALRDELQKQMEIVANMGEALKAGEFVVFLQPKINMFTDKVIGAEALVRWFKPDGTRVSPGDFVPIFEKNGFITQIDFEILRQVLVMQQERLRQGKPIVKISVNFSRKHQENPNYIRQLDEMLAKYEVPTKSLEIEITESVFMYDLKPLTENITQLKQRGLSISIDDFGAGYSSLNVLSKVKADIVKLDRQFLLDVEMEKDNYTADFLQIMINMIQQLGFKVLAEGVETEEQVDLLKNAGCSLAQGYYYAKPMPVDEFLAFIDSHELETAE